MKPFLLLSTRPEDAASEGEREAIVRLAGLSDDDIVQYRVERESLPPIDLDDYSGVFLGGGPFNASDDPKSDHQDRIEADIFRVIDDAVHRDFPFLGLCYGVGALTSRLGGVVDRTYGEDAGVATATLTSEGRDDRLFDGIPSEMVAFVGHKEASSQLPDGAVLLATGIECPVQAFRLGSNVYATQFHPELDRPGMVSRLRIYSQAGYFHPSETETLVAFAADAPISPEVHRVLANFVAIARRREASSADQALSPA